MNRVGKIVPPKRQILKDISLSFFPGAKIGVLGLNGSGKSSLLKIMAGLDKDIQGEAVPMPNLNIGYLPQEPQLDPEQTVREAVESSTWRSSSKRRQNSNSSMQPMPNQMLTLMHWQMNRLAWKQSFQLRAVTMLNCNLKWLRMPYAYHHGIDQ